EGYLTENATCFRSAEDGFKRLLRVAEPTADFLEFTELFVDALHHALRAFQFFAHSGLALGGNVGRLHDAIGQRFVYRIEPLRDRTGKDDDLAGGLRLRGRDGLQSVPQFRHLRFDGFAFFLCTHALQRNPNDERRYSEQYCNKNSWHVISPRPRETVILLYAHEKFRKVGKRKSPHVYSRGVEKLMETYENSQ